VWQRATRQPDSIEEPRVERSPAPEHQILRPDQARGRALRDQLMALHREREALLRGRVPEFRATIGAEREHRDLERRLRNVEPAQARIDRMPAVDSQRELTLRATVAAERVVPTRRQARVAAGSDLVTIAKSAAKSATSAAARLPAVARSVAGSLALP